MMLLKGLWRTYSKKADDHMSRRCWKIYQMRRSSREGSDEEDAQPHALRQRNPADDARFGVFRRMAMSGGGCSTGAQQPLRMQRSSGQNCSHHLRIGNSES